MRWRHGGLRGSVGRRGWIPDGARGCGGIRRGVLEFSGVGDLDRSAGAEEGFGERGEVLHVGAEDDGDAGFDGFDGVLAAAGHEAFSNEDDGGASIPTGQLAGGVHEQGIGFFHRAGFGAAGEAEAGLGELVGDGIRAFLMAGNEDEEKRWVVFSELLEDFGE